MESISNKRVTKRQRNQLLTEAQATYVKTIPGRDFRLSGVLMALGRLALNKGDAAAAESFIRESLQIRQGLLEGNDWEPAYIAATLGRCLGALDRLDEANPLLLSGLTVLETELGTGAPETQEIRAVVERLHVSREN